MVYNYPKVLFVDSSYPIDPLGFKAFAEHAIDYTVYERMPNWWRGIEKLLKLDIFLALNARRVAHRFNVILAGSERVGIPLALMHLKRPLVTFVYSMGSPLKKLFLRLFSIPVKWSRVGYLTEADRDFMSQAYGYPDSRMFRCIAAPLDRFSPSTPIGKGPIVSAGVIKRDYRTLLSALEQLPECEAQIFASSRYGDRYSGPIANKNSSRIRFMKRVSNKDMAPYYEKARFVVVPLYETHQFSAGFSAALEALAAGKAVIATNTRGMRECVLHGETGLLVPPNDSGALKQAIQRLLDDPALAHEMGQAGRRIAEKHYKQSVAGNELRRALLEAGRECMKSYNS